MMKFNYIFFLSFVERRKRGLIWLFYQISKPDFLFTHKLHANLFRFVLKWMGLYWDIVVVFSTFCSMITVTEYYQYILFTRNRVILVMYTSLVYNVLLFLVCLHGTLRSDKLQNRICTVLILNLRVRAGFRMKVSITFNYHEHWNIVVTLL